MIRQFIKYIGTTHLRRFPCCPKCGLRHYMRISKDVLVINLGAEYHGLIWHCDRCDVKFNMPKHCHYVCPWCKGIHQICNHCNGRGWVRL